MSKQLILGTAQFGLDYGVNNESGRINYDQIKKILDYSFKNKTLILDTAPSYGEAEKQIGRYLKNNPNKNFKIITKISTTKKSLEHQLNNSLLNLKVKKLDCLLFHSIGLYKYFFGEIDLFTKKNKGLKFRELGVSIYTNDEIEYVLKDNFIDRVQLPFNLLDNSSSREESIKKLRSRGIKIDARSIFLQGLFFKPIEELNSFFKPLYPELKKLHRIAINSNQSISEMAFKYVNQKDFIDRMLIGVDSIDQLQLNLSYTDKPMLDKYSFLIDSIAVRNIHLLNPSLWPK